AEDHADMSLEEFVDELARRAAAQHAPVMDGVTLASLHAAKGLEWDAVFLVGLTEGMVPITYAKTDTQIEEERRLLYVGVTRARRHLTLSWALSRSPGGRAGRRPSRFLNGLRPGSAAGGARTTGGGGGIDRGGAGVARTPRKGRGPVRCRVCGRSLTDPGEMKLMRCEGCPSDLDEQLYERLREWRSEQAKELGQPAYCVFTDKTLMAIAERVPDDEAALAQISGVGGRKLERFGADVLALCGGEELAAAEPGGEAGSERREDVTEAVTESAEK
ncbi:MAG: HRDC domain-containing protein, partial [Streptomyces sp.]|uniref:HRDC domain-containing protein n=1 Tax=Streptomyces sp. TaxID=1931 RepID=UPI003D6B6F5E